MFCSILSLSKYERSRACISELEKFDVCFCKFNPDIGRKPDYSCHAPLMVYRCLMYFPLHFRLPRFWT